MSTCKNAHLVPALVRVTPLAPQKWSLLLAWPMQPAEPVHLQPQAPSRMLRSRHPPSLVLRRSHSFWPWFICEEFWLPYTPIEIMLFFCFGLLHTVQLSLDCVARLVMHCDGFMRCCICLTVIAWYLITCIPPPFRWGWLLYLSLLVGKRAAYRSLQSMMFVTQYVFSRCASAAGCQIFPVVCPSFRRVQ